MKITLCIVAVLAPMASSILLRADEPKEDEGWISLFDGKSFEGWKASENKDSWKIVDGAFVCHGPRSHLFYVGKEAPFVNFHFKCEVMTRPGSNAGIYFHTKYQEEGWPKFGYEAQVNATHGDPKKTGSLYAVKDVLQPNHKDDQWYTQEVIVEGKRIQIKVNGKTVVDFTEEPDRKPGADFTRVLEKEGGTFALQAHDPGSEVHFRKIMVRKLP